MKKIEKYLIIAKNHNFCMAFCNIEIKSLIAVGCADLTFHPFTST